MNDTEQKEFSEFLTSTLFVVDDIMKNNKNYYETFDLLYGYMKQGFEIEAVRKHPLNFIFHNGKDEPIKQIQIRHFITNMICWSPVIKLGVQKDLDETFILDCSILNKNYMMSYLDEKIIIPYRKNITNKKMNRLCEQVIHKLSQISLDFNMIMGTTINIESFISLSQTNPEFNDIIRTSLPDENMQPKEIEEMLHNKMLRLISIMKTEDNCLKPMLCSGEGIKDKQLSEFAVMGGLKPDIVGNTIPVPIDTNFIVGGLNSIRSFYVDKQSGRKSVVMNKTSMGKSGYFASKIMKLTQETTLSKLEKCDTRRLVEFHIKSKKHLQMINGRYYSMKENSGKLKLIDSRKDKDLIGKHIFLRSPSTCSAPGNTVCHTCYGQMSYINKDYGFNIGAFAAVNVSNKMIQDILSTKHLLTTNSITIDFNEDFYKFFTLESNRIVIKPDDIDNIEHYSLIIEQEDLYELVLFDESDFNEFTSKLYIKNNKTKERTLISEMTGKDIFIFAETGELFERNEEYIELNLSKLETDTDFGIIIVENNELTKPLKNMMRLLDRKDHYDCETVDDLSNKMCDLLIEAGIRSDLLHSEVIMRNIVRSKRNILEFPRFNRIDITDSDYTILRVTEALVDNPSLTVGLSSQELKKQFIDPSTYTKHAKSQLDIFFKPTLK